MPRQSSENAIAECVDAALQLLATKRGLGELELVHLRFIAAGYTNQQMADQRTVSVNTVKSEVGALYRRLGVHGKGTIADLVRAARQTCASGAAPREVAALIEQFLAT